MKAVLDSNVFVAAAFNPRSSSARLLEMAREGQLRLMWHKETREETRLQLERIPPISWQPFADLFQEPNRFSGDLGLGGYDFVEDRDDRKFAALAEKCDTLLVSNDQDLLSVAERLSISVLTPGDAVRMLGDS